MNSIASSPVFDEAYYRDIYRNYARQNPAYKLRVYRELILRHVPSRDDVSILDVGCAFGHFLCNLPERWRRFGIDASEYAIKQAQSQSGGISFAAATLEKNPFDGPFDVITAFDVIEHIPDLERVRETVQRLLKPNGVFLFVVPVYDGPLGPLVHILDRDPTHLHKTGREFWKTWISQGFALEEWQGMYRYLTPIGFYVHYRSQAFRRYSPAIAVVARKLA